MRTVVLLQLLTLLLWPRHVAAQSPPPITLTFGGEGSGNGQFLEPTALAIAPNGDIFVCDDARSCVQRFSGKGIFISKWGSLGSGPGQFTWPTGIAVDDSGFVWVADRFNDNLQQFTETGIFVRAITPTWMGRIINPNRLSVAPDGSFYITSNHEVAHVSRSGAVLQLWGGYGAGVGQFNLAIGIGTSDDEVCVVDHYNERFQTFTPTGAFLGSQGVRGTGAGEFYRIHALTIDSSGNIYVTDSGPTGHGRIQKYDRNHNFLQMWDTPSDPMDIAADEHGNLFMLSFSECKVHKYANVAVRAEATTWGRLKARYR